MRKEYRYVRLKIVFLLLSEFFEFALSCIPCEPLICCAKCGYEMRVHAHADNEPVLEWNGLVVEPQRNAGNLHFERLECSPKTDPGGMRVSKAREGMETGDERATEEAA